MNYFDQNTYPLPLIMRILHLSTTLRGGAGIAASRLNQALCESGMESYIHCLTVDADSIERNVSLVRRTSKARVMSKVLTYIQFRLISNPGKSLSVISIDSINYRKIKDFSPDVINVHSMYNLLNHVTLLKLSKMGYPIVLTLHDQRSFTGGCHYSNGCTKFTSSCNACPQASYIGRKFVKRFHRRNSKALNRINNLAVIAPSQWLANLSQMSSVLRNFPTSVINNPIPSATSQWEKEVLVKRIGFVASDLQNPLKNLNSLLRAIKKLDGQIQNLELVLIGKGEVETNLSQIKVFKLENLTQTQIAEAVTNLHLLVVPSLEDNSPNVIGEALMNGTRVIGAKTGGIPELLEYNDDLLFDPLDIEEIARAISRNLSDYCGADVKLCAEERFSYRSVAKKYIEIYKSVI
jgi:glycosyltransferase involved in cell wall biosynthesis